MAYETSHCVNCVINRFHYRADFAEDARIIPTPHAMRTVTTIALIFSLAATGLALGACSARSGESTAHASSRLTTDEKHRLYSAALAASESPLDTDTFKDVCRRIEIFDRTGKPNENYIAFVSEHLKWSMKSETDQFRQQIDSREKALAYVRDHLSR